MLIRFVLALFAIIALMWAGLRIAGKSDGAGPYSRAGAGAVQVLQLET